MQNAQGRITLWGIEVFVATAEEGSISVAARRLGASASAISQQLTALEAAAGTALLNRNERPVTLTLAGESFRKRAQTILNEAAQARAELARAGSTRFTRLRLGMIEDFEADVTPTLLTELADTLPDCQFQLETGASHWLLGQLDARAVDMVVCAEMGARAEWMEVHPLLEESFVVVVQKGVVDPAEDIMKQLQDMLLISYTTQHYMGRLLAEHLARQNFKVEQRYELDSYHAILSLVASGVGWTILTPLALMRANRFLDRVDVHGLPLDPLTRRIVLSARKSAVEGAVVQARDLLMPILHDYVDQDRLGKFITFSN